MTRPHPAPGGTSGEGPGTPEAVWRPWLAGLDLPEVDPAALGRAVLVCSAHPDDDVLGAGALLHAASAAGVQVRVLVATDGEASHPGSRVLGPGELARRRVEESAAAYDALGVRPVEHVRLGLPDGGLAAAPAELADALARACDGVDAVLAPWSGDAHPDHDAIGAAAATAAAGAGLPLLAFPVWAWMWAAPRDPRLPWGTAVRAPAAPAARAAKRRAVDCYATQVRPLGPAPEDAAVLTPAFLEHVDREAELFFAADRDGGGPVTLPPSYFDGVYAGADDPWSLRTRWYERRKYALTTAVLPRERYGDGLEVGCSVGELTAALAARCDRLTGWDVSAAAVERARARTAGLAGVRVERRAVPADPLPEVDLLVLSEVLYYLDAADLATVLAAVATAVRPGGTLLAVHWRHPVADYPLTGDAVHAALRGTFDWPRVAVHEEPDFLLDCWVAAPPGDARSASVAAAEELW